MDLRTTPLMSRSDLRWPQWTAVALIAVLVFIWPVPRTISLRDLLLLLLLCWGGYEVYRHRAQPLPWRALRMPLGFFLALTAWILVVALLLSTEPTWALGEIKGQWLKACIALVVGGLVGATTFNNDFMRRLILMVVGAMLLLHVLYVDYEGLRLILANLNMRRIAGLTEGSDKSNYLTNMLLCLLLAEALVRMITRCRFLPLSNSALAAMAVVAFFSVYVEGMRNGIVELVSVFGVGFLLVAMFTSRRRRAIMVSAMLVLVSVSLTLGYLSLRKDERWQSVLETVPIALDLENPAWINEGLPQPELESGQKVDWSNYMRIARMRAGVELVREYPLGVGFGRNAFGHAVEMKYGLRTSHSHSGLVDLAVGTGIPGTLLWLGFLGSLFVLGWRRFRQTHDYYALALLLLVTGYSVRMVLDSIIRDHMLQMFLFLAAFLAVIVAGQLRGGQRETPVPPA